MRKQRMSHASGFLLGFVLSFLSLSGGDLAVAEAACPPHLSYYGWQPPGGLNSGVVNYYAQPNAPLTQQEVDNIGVALGRWSVHNTTINCSNVTFHSVTNSWSYALQGSLGQVAGHPAWRGVTTEVTSGGYVYLSIDLLSTGYLPLLNCSSS